MITDKLSDFPWHLENNAGGKTSVLPHHFGQENLLDLAGIGLWLFDACGETTYVNNAIATRLGYSREELLALPMIALTGQEQLTEAMRLTRGQKQKPRKSTKRGSFIAMGRKSGSISLRFLHLTQRALSWAWPGY